MAVRRTTHFQGYRYTYDLQGVEWPPRWPWWLTPSFPAPLVFVNGTFHSQESWNQYARQFGKKRTVLLAELPGTGESGFLPDRYGIDFLAGSLRHILDDEKIPRVNLVASSDGTVVAYRFSQLYPDRLASLILAGTMTDLPPHLKPRVDSSLSSLQRGAMDEFAQNWVGTLMCGDPDKNIANRRVAEGVLRTDLIRMPGQQRAKYLANAQRLMRHLPLDLSEAPNVRVLVFTGEHDEFTTSAYCRAIASAFPAALFTTIQDADHLFHIERFDTTAKLVEQFINDEPLEGIPEINAVEILRRSKPEEKPKRANRVVIPMRPRREKEEPKKDPREDPP
jgi:pimeloyl-ACP methyl ester carboxylesterase